MVPRLRPRLGPAEVAALAPSRGDDVGAFETAFAATMHQRNAVAFPYGRTGLVALLQALDIRDREVICPAYTCVVVPHAIVASGNEPVFVDSSDHDFNMDLSLVEAAITPRTSAIVATSIFGYPVDLDQLDAIRRQHPTVAIIQDCAHSFGARWRGREVQRAGIAAVFGLNVSKLLTSIFGGMITTDDDELAARIRGWRSAHVAPAGIAKSARRALYLLATMPAFWGPLYGIVNRLERMRVLDHFVRYYDDHVIDMPKDYLTGLSPVEARVGRAQTARYQRIVNDRRAVAASYDRALRGLRGLRLPPLVDGATYSHYVPRVADRAAVMEHCRRRGVQLGEIIEYSIPELAAYRDRPGNRFPCPVSRELSRTTINLPCHMPHGRVTTVSRALEQSIIAAPRWCSSARRTSTEAPSRPSDPGRTIAG